jgi:two-component system sensor histidine kinase/response regulator
MDEINTLLAQPKAAGGIATDERTRSRAHEIFIAHSQEVWRRTDSLFARLLAIQWLVGIGVALWLTPRTWIGAASTTHLHVWAAIFLGGAFALFPALLVWARPGETITRHVIAVSQMLASGLLIHLTGGRIETHFHIFGSLAFLAFYRDRRVLITASLVTAADHLIRGVYWPASIFGTMTPSAFRALEHIGWVIFEVAFLLIACRQSIQAMRNIAERQAELEFTNARIEKTVQERTGELDRSNLDLQREVTVRRQTEIDLVDAKQRAEAADRAKSSFLAHMSHEIRTPMNGVIGMTSLLLDSKLTDDQRGFGEIIRQSGESLLTIINEILDFSKIEAGQLELERHPFQLMSCVEDVLDLFGLECARKNLDIACCFDAETPPAIVSDPTRLRQVLVNLVGNAIKFTEHGQVVVEISSRAMDRVEIPVANEYLAVLDREHYDDEQWVQLTFKVRDTGSGIPADRLHRLFQPFSQVDATITRRHGGTGLGLVITKRLIESLGGTIRVETELGVGTTFVFSLFTKSTHSSHKVSLTVPAELKHQRVLIVDDAEINRRILGIQTERWGMVPQVFEKPTDALAWLKDLPEVDLAILDWQMPEMDGQALAREIHAMSKYSRLPLVLLSSSLPPVEEETARPSEFVARQMKPIRQADLLNAILTALGTRRSNSANLIKTTDPTLAARLPFRVLLVEDNVTNQKVAARVMQQFGYRVDLVANGLEALEAVRRQPYDIVLMDVQMPEMDGLEATRQICERYLPSERPYIIAMTAHALKEDRQMCLDAGMDDYVSKPIRADMIRLALERAASSLHHVSSSLL